MAIGQDKQGSQGKVREVKKKVREKPDNSLDCV